ncbi:MAG: hypothetical protein Q8O81_06445, partial [Giesbergeria sp.]|nr:hypothetical protein [Giesbergeria sp.]
MTIKVTGTTDSCGKCPNYGYYSGGAYECRLVELVVHDKTVVDPFCPLPDYPAAIIAGQQMTIKALREPHVYGLGFMLLAHVAAKLGATLSPRGKSLTLLLASGVELVLDSEYITAERNNPAAIEFFAGDKT